ncbi:MAG TPA: hypothetical protein VHK69_13540 [Chitinophagaceae bacterium]|jgi:hypothetical protein|nr:hypothetical protein [Chitinophagaceae bacterium]
MRWTLYPVLGLIITACTLHGQQQAVQTAAVRPAQKEDPRELQAAKARDMFDHFRKSSVNKNVSFFVEFDRAELIRLLEESDQPTVKLLVGAYSDEDDDDKKQRPTILVQVGNGTTGQSLASRPFVTYRYFTSDALCPPPSPCRLEQ